MKWRGLWKFAAAAVVAVWLWMAIVSPVFVAEWKPLTSEQIDDWCGWQDRYLQRECRDHHVRLNGSMQQLNSKNPRSD
jgi:hypothetical protein